MNTSTNDRVLRAIKKREDLEAEKISVKKLLKIGGVENWTDLCCDRIAENELLDGDEASINFADFPDIELTSRGLLQCKEILLSYVTEDLLTDSYRLLCSYENLTQGANEYACMLREMKNITLFKTYIELGKKKYADEDGRIRKYILTEAWSRSVFMQMGKKVYAGLIRLCTRIKYHKLIVAVKKFKEAECNAK